MLSGSMEQELTCFFSTVCYGFLISACYHPLVFLRSLITHKKAVTDAEDILFLMAAGFYFFLVVYDTNDGILRWYTFAGAGLGGLAYVHTLCIPVEAVRKWLLQKLGKTFTMKEKYRSKGQVSVNESCSPEHRQNRKKKKWS